MNIPQTVGNITGIIIARERVSPCDSTAHTTQLKVVRSKDRLTASGEPRSLGYGFVEFKNHEDAMAVLRAMNNNPDVFTRDRR